MIKVIAVLLSVYLCIENSYYKGVYTGYNIGAAMGGICYPKIGDLCISHGDPYSEIIKIHFYINWLLIFFIAGKLLKKETLSQIISLPSIFLAFLGFVQIYNLKSGYASDANKYIDLMRLTLQSDFIHIWLALALLIYQIIAAFQYYSDWKNNKVRIE